MKQEKRLNIGVLTCHIDTEYAQNICDGIIHAAEDMDANVIFFPGMYVSAFYNSLQSSEYDYQFNTLYDYAIHSGIDVLIISLGTLAPYINYSDIDVFLKRFKDSSIIILEEDIPGYNCLTINNDAGLRACLEHLIDDHGYKKICFVNGKRNNRDSAERLAVYQNVLQEHGIAYDSSMVTYGNFSQYCEDIVSKMLDQHPDTEAICCANDLMALGCYKALEARGLRVGKDIAVTGFDDIAVSFFAYPPLSSVQVSAHELAYRAVIEGINVYNGKPFQRQNTLSRFIKRTSCGCTRKEANLYADIEPDAEECITLALDYILYHHESEQLNQKLRSAITELFAAYRSYDGTNYSSSYFVSALSQITNADWSRHIKIDKLFLAIRDYIWRIIATSTDAKLILALSTQIVTLLENNITVNANALNQVPIDFMNIRWLSSGIVRDALIFSKDMKNALKQMLDKLHMLGIRSSSIYLFDAPIVHEMTDEWRRPDFVRLVAYHNGEEKFLLNDEDCPVAIGNIFDAEHITRSYRHTKAIFNLFINNEQYGLLVCELDLSKFDAAYSASLEISSALKYLNMNRRLLSISTTDELTRLDNRRGFFEKVNYIIQEHYGQDAILFFADLDSLKMINDNFGHEEGDFALMCAASILKRSFRRDDIVARLGGDEFIAFALARDSSIIDQLKSRIKEHTEILNATSGVPYYIEMSYGYTSFVCATNIQLEAMIKLADHSLYANKKFKRVSPFREPIESTEENMEESTEERTDNT